MQEFDDEKKDDEDNEPAMAQGSKQLIVSVSALLQEHATWKKRMFEQLLANHSTLMVGQELLSQRQDVLNQNVMELKTSKRDLLSHPFMAQVGISVPPL